MPASISLQPFTKHRKNAPQRPGRSGAIATTEVLLHSSEHPKLDYTAREEEEGGSDALLKHYVGVYDPKTGKLEVMEARKMVVRGSVRAHQATEAEFEKQVGILQRDFEPDSNATLCRLFENFEMTLERLSVPKRRGKLLLLSLRMLFQRTGDRD